MPEHKIKKLVVDFRAPQGKNLHKLHNTISSLAGSCAKNVIGEVFDNSFPGLYIKRIRIDRLVVDIGPIMVKNLERDFSILIREKLHEQLERCRNYEINVFDEREMASAQPDGAILISDGESGLKLLEYFLDYGYLPWWAGAEEYISLEDLIKQLMSGSLPELAKIIRIRIMRISSRQRIIYQLSDKMLEEITVRILKLKRNLVREFLEFLTGIWGSIESVPKHEIRIIFWENVIRFSLKHDNGKLHSKQTGKITDIEKFVMSLITSVSQIPGTDRSQSKLLIDRLIETNPAIKEYSDLLNAEKIEFDNANENNTGYNSEISVEVKDEIYIENAGVVLLAPFLAGYFKELDLLEKSSFKNKHSLEKAVHLIQYLATNESETDERFLCLNKILCGIDILYPVVKVLPLNKVEFTESVDLLNSVIRNWPALKKTTPAGLRNTFLKRNGILEKNPDGWLLRVERNSFDVLIDKIPWGFSVIKLPWMKNILYVEW